MRLNNMVFDTEEWEVSPDGITYTYTEHDAGVTKPTVIVLHRMDNR